MAVERFTGRGVLMTATGGSQSMEFDGNTATPDMFFDGGDLDCGSGLILLIREHMLKTPVDGILEMRSREPTVADDLPPWCRMSGHAYLGKATGEGFSRYFIRRGSGVKEDEAALSKDKAEAKGYRMAIEGQVDRPSQINHLCPEFLVRCRSVDKF